MKKIRQKVAIWMVTAIALTGVGLFTAGPASAYTDTYWKYQYNCMPYPSGAFQWRDFNWWEEMWGEHDRYVWKYNFYRYC